MTLKADMQRIFTQPPCSFVFHADDTQATGHDGAIIQCKDDHTASLLCMMPGRYLDVVRRNTSLLVTLLLVSGWTDGDRWLAACFREAAWLPHGKIFMQDTGKRRYTLIVDREHELVTLTVKEPA